MLNDAFMREFCETLRKRFLEAPDSMIDAVALLDDLGRQSATEADAHGTAQTILEMLEPERLGKVMCMRCNEPLDAVGCGCPKLGDGEPDLI